MTSVLAHVGLGANLGNPEAAIAAALEALAALPSTELLQSSPRYRTQPIDAAGPDYFNAVAQLRTGLTPHRLLAELQRIELALGRERPYRNAPRTLDLDLLLHGDAVLQNDQLTLPHPRLHERAFVLAPLADLAPWLVVPGRGEVRALLESVQGQRIERIDPPPPAIAPTSP